MLRYCSLIFACFAWPVLAWAQDVAQSPDAPWWQTALITAIAGFGTAAAGLIGKLLHYAADLVAQKAKLAWLSRIDEALMAVVHDLANTTVASAKEKTADGKLTKAEAEKFKQEAIAAIKRQFSRSTLGKVLNAATGAELDSAIASRVERAVNETKAKQAAGKPLAVSPLTSPAQA